MNSRHGIRLRVVLPFLAHWSGFSLRWSISLGLAVALASGVSGEGVKGAELVESAANVESILYDLVELPLEKKELGSFLKQAESVLDWSEANAAEWKEADASEAPLAVIRAFPIWEQIDGSASEFIATLVKLLFLREYVKEPDSLQSLRREIEVMEEALAKNTLSGYTLERAKSEIESKRRRVTLLETVLPGNVRLYKGAKERIDSLLNRFEQIGE